MTARAAIAIAVLGLTNRVAADPLRLRADALATSTSPAGLLVLEADGEKKQAAGDAGTLQLAAEAVVWVAGTNAPGEDASGEVLVVAVRARDQRGIASGQVGRFVSTLGALRPVHVDGGSGRVRLPGRFTIEAVAGVPVLPVDVTTARSFDWIAGGRVARRIGDYGSVGVAYAQRRDAGMLASEEIGGDAGIAFDKRHDLGARIAYDVVGSGIAEVGLTASRRSGGLRSEIYARHRAASHLLPATSLFSVIGDVPSQRAGVVWTWRAAPRLDLIGDIAARRVDDDVGEEVTGRARLKLNDRGTSLLSGELRRAGGDTAAWSGARTSLQLALPCSFGITTEVELVIPDDDRGRGTIWPWALVAGTWKRGVWEAALAIEASSSPEYRYRVDGLAQLTRRWSMR